MSAFALNDNLPPSFQTCSKKINTIRPFNFQTHSTKNVQYFAIGKSKYPQDKINFDFFSSLFFFPFLFPPYYYFFLPCFLPSCSIFPPFLLLIFLLFFSFSSFHSFLLFLLVVFLFFSLFFSFNFFFSIKQKMMAMMSCKLIIIFCN